MVCRGRFPLLLPSTKYRNWHRDALLQIKNRKKIKSKNITLTFYAGDNRKFDLTNKAESIMDTLVDAELIEDDNYSVINELCLKFGGVDKGKARCEIEY